MWYYVFVGEGVVPLQKLPDNLENKMNNTAISRVLNTIENSTEKYSLGFLRFHSLPQRVRTNIMKLHVQETGKTNYLPRIKAFLAGLTHEEFIEWMKTA